MNKSNHNLGDELFDRLKRIQNEDEKAALATTRKLQCSKPVSDGELLDALYIFSVRLDIANPLLPVCHETLKRLMKYGGITETPRGLQRAWLESCSNPDCVAGKVQAGCTVDGPLLLSDCPDCSHSKDAS